MCRLNYAQLCLGHSTIEYGRPLIWDRSGHICSWMCLFLVIHSHTIFYSSSGSRLVHGYPCCIHSRESSRSVCQHISSSIWFEHRELHLSKPNPGPRYSLRPAFKIQHKAPDQSFLNALSMSRVRRWILQRLLTQQFEGFFSINLSTLRQNSHDERSGNSRKQ